MLDRTDQVTAAEVWNVRQILCGFLQSHIFVVSIFLNFNSCCYEVACQAANVKGFSLSRERMLNVTACTSCFTLNILTLLAVTTNIPSGLPVTEAQLA